MGERNVHTHRWHTAFHRSGPRAIRVKRPRSTHRPINLTWDAGDVWGTEAPKKDARRDEATAAAMLAGRRETDGRTDCRCATRGTAAVPATNAMMRSYRARGTVWGENSGGRRRWWRG